MNVGPYMTYILYIYSFFFTLYKKGTLHTASTRNGVVFEKVD